MILSVTPVFADPRASNDFVNVDLLSDVELVYSAMDYKVGLMALDRPMSNPDIFTTAWLGLYLADGSGQIYPQKFVQVGIKTDLSGVYWYVYAEPGVQCLEGAYDYWDPVWLYYKGCHGYNNEYVSLGANVTVELATSIVSNVWYVTIWETSGGGQPVGHTVAVINYDSKRIYWATATMEEAIPKQYDPYDPYLMADFFISHPQFKNQTTGVFNEWPVSPPPSWPTQKNVLRAVSNYPGRVICPYYYGAVLNISSDPRYWRVGTYGTICDAIMFPGFYLNLPIVMNE